MTLSNELLLILCAYLIGSVPTAVWLGKLFYSTDVRDFGSGNAGATNTFRVLGPKLGIPVLLIDVIKGYLAVVFIAFSTAPADSEKLIVVQLALGTAALAGHIFPVYAGFKGGKGIATLLGFMLAVAPEASVICILIFLLVFSLSKIVSLSSISAALTFPVINIAVLQGTPGILMVFSVAVALVVLITHRKNIVRIVNNEESKINLNRKNQDDE